jgi:hypothetical protein
MLNRKGQTNIIVSIGVIAAVIYVMFNLFNYVNLVGMSSKIDLTAQTSIYQSLMLKDYIAQQTSYLFDEAQVFDGLLLAPPQISCGYINSSTSLPFIPIPKIYYWHTVSGQTCLPNNQQIVYSLESLLNQTQFSTINSSGQNVETYLDINLSKVGSEVFQGSFSAPYLRFPYTFKFFRANSSVLIFNGSGTSLVQSTSIGGTFYLESQKYTFDIGPEADAVTGVLNQQAALSPFFRGVVGLSPDSQYALASFPNGQSVIIYDTPSQKSFEIAPIYPSYSSTLTAAEESLPQTVSNNSVFVLNGVEYSFEDFLPNVSLGFVNPIFIIEPTSFAVLQLQPSFIYYKYVISSFELRNSENLLFPNNNPIFISLSTVPYYNPQVCVSYNEIQYTVKNCLSLSNNLESSDYLSNLLQMGIAFVNQTFQVGNTAIQGFPEYRLYNYLANVVNAINMKTVSVAGQPKYDWYSNLILSLGSPLGTASLINSLAPAKENYYGTTVYNCTRSASVLTMCRGLLQSTLSTDLKYLFESEIPAELSFLSGTQFSVNMLGLNVSAREAQSCSNSNLYSSSVNYAFQPPRTSVLNSSEVLGIPISLVFGYNNSLYAQPTEGCGTQTSVYNNGYPGFETVLTDAHHTLFNCAPILPKEFLNSTCIANLATTNSSVASYIGNCKEVTGATPYYVCSNYHFKYFSADQWILHGNNCPDFVVVDNQNFTYSGVIPTTNNFYSVISTPPYGGGADKVVDSPNNWTFSLISKPALSLPNNVSIHLGTILSGPAPVMNILLSRYSSTSQPFSVLRFNGYNGNDQLLNFSGNSSLTSIAQAGVSALPGTNTIELRNFCLSANSCSFQVYSNSVLEMQVNGSETSFNSNKGIGMLGFSTDQYPSNDTLSYVFATTFIPSYTPIVSISQPQSAVDLNPFINASFNLLTDLNTKYTEVTLNPFGKLSTSYQLEVILNSYDFSLSMMSPQNLEVFGVYPNSTTIQLYWWNQTAIQNGAILWVKLPEVIPNTLYFVYGDGALNNEAYSSNPDNVFPLFMSNFTGFGRFSLNQTSLQSSINYTSYGVDLIKSGPIPPFIYSSTPSLFYQEFACVQAKPTLNITLVNASYSPYKPPFNTQDLFGVYNPLYPNLTIISAVPLGSGSSSTANTTFYSTLPLKSTWSMTYDGVQKTQNTSVSQVIWFDVSSGNTFSFASGNAAVPCTSGGKVGFEAYTPSPKNGTLVAGGSQTISYRPLGGGLCQI